MKVVDTDHDIDLIQVGRIVYLRIACLLVRHIFLSLSCLSSFIIPRLS